ncbi:MAG: cyclic lactone autoinducer peptide [Lachnospiraceae bacterium]|nr:cyclic lactone autoinducer peptide [Ruminococcus sp.]MCM1276257.1 cyclic lactone autoinducer peptide [Lachnospiraceae bacterium]
MKNSKLGSKSIAKKAIAAAAKMATSVNVNSACAFVIHQPKLPKGAEKLRKF